MACHPRDCLCSAGVRVARPPCSAAPYLSHHYFIHHTNLFPRSTASKCCSEYVPVKQRRAAVQSGRLAPAFEPMPPPPPRPSHSSRQQRPAAPTGSKSGPQRPQASLLKANAEAQRGQPVKSAAEKAAEEEREMMAAMLKKQALRSVQENAIGVVYDRTTCTGWRPPSWCVTSPHRQLLRYFV